MNHSRGLLGDEAGNKLNDGRCARLMKGLSFDQNFGRVTSGDRPFFLRHRSSENENTTASVRLGLQRFYLIHLGRLWRCSDREWVGRARRALVCGCYCSDHPPFSRGHVAMEQTPFLED